MKSFTMETSNHGLTTGMSLSVTQGATRGRSGSRAILVPELQNLDQLIKLQNNQSDLEEWIPASINQRVCKKFVHKAAKAEGSVSERRCNCGYLESQHDEEARRAEEPSTKDWSVYKNTKAVPTAAYGDIEFVGYGQKLSQFVRIDHLTDENLVLTLMLDFWKLTRPNLLISVTGGAKNFSMRPRLNEVFNRGLMKAAASTGAWIITGGMHAGVMKQVGKAVQDYETAYGTKDNITVIGIAPWGCVTKKKLLIDPEGSWPAYYRIDDQKMRRESPIDRNHSHFILVDNGTQHVYGTEIAFRAKLERAISLMKTESDEDDVPVPAVCVVLEGGPGTLETVKSAIQNGTPAVIVEGSGRAADILAFAYANSREEEVEVTDNHGQVHKKSVTIADDDIWEEVARKVQEEFGSREVAQKLSWVKECLEHRKYMTIFRLDSSDTKDIDVAILRALLKVNKDDSTGQLRLALTWNRTDVAKSDIFTEEKKWEPEVLNPMMYSALQHNQVDFIELFLENGCSPRDFLTIRTLLQLYNNIPKNTLLYTLLARQQKNKDDYFTLKDVGSLLRKLLGDFYSPLYIRDPRYCDLDTKQILEGTLDDPVNGFTPRGKQAVTNQNGGARPELPANDTYMYLSTSENANRGQSMVVYDPQSGKPIRKPDFDEPCLDIFMWCVLLNRMDMALLFMKEGKDTIAASVLAQRLLKSMLERTEDSEVVRNITSSLEQFETKSVGMLTQCYASDEKKARVLLVREMGNLGHSTVLQLAVKSDMKSFVAHSACQGLLTNVWRGKMALDVSTIRMWICMMFPFLIYPLIKFRPDDRGHLTSSFRTAKRVKEQASGNQEPVDSEILKTREEAGDRISWWKQIGYFYNAPLITFMANCVSYLAFLVYYSIILLTNFHRERTYHEIVLIFWVHTLFVEEVRQVIEDDSGSVRRKLLSYIRDIWNILDVLTILSFNAGMILRHISEDTCADCFKAGRIVLAINLMTFCFRILHIFSVIKHLGPKLVMIGKMMIDMCFFLIILLVFILAYGLAAQAILYPNTEMGIGLFRDVIRKPYFQMYGELFLEEMEGTLDCSKDPALYSNGTIARCPEGTVVAPILLGGYILISNVLMLNLLIAMFSNTFNAVQEHTDQHWYFQRYFLVKEYFDRPPLAPPLIILSHLYIFARKCFHWCGCWKYRPYDDFKIKLTVSEEKQLILWEALNVDEYHLSASKEEGESMQNQIQQANERVDKLASQLDELAESSLLLQGDSSCSSQPAKLPPALEERMTLLEDQMKRTSKALDWIVASMVERGVGAKRGPPKLVDVDSLRETAAARRQEQANKEKEQYQQLFLKQLELHFKARSLRYPCVYQAVVRFHVPNAKVPWEEPWDSYEPVKHTDVCVLTNTEADPIDLLECDSGDCPDVYSFNAMDEKYGVDRCSHHGVYQIVRGLPLNPKGRTGMIGRGLLWRWGPNHASDPIVTRWCRTSSGAPLMENEKRVLEFVAIYRHDSKKWAIPGGMMRSGMPVDASLWIDFSKEALGSLMEDETTREDVRAKLDTLFENGTEVYCGYADDRRNTDNAWVETVAVNYHDEDGTVTRPFQLRAGENVELVRWMKILSRQSLYGGHLAILQKVAKLHDAAF